MGLLDNVFIKKAITSMMTQEQFTVAQNFMTAVQSGKIDKEKLTRVGEKISKLSVEQIDSLLDLIDKNF